MTVRRILTWPDKNLLNHAKKVENFDNDLISLCKDMADTMIASFGVGLAATQVNVQRSVCILSKTVVSSLNPDPIMSSHVVLVNPKIQCVGKEKFKWPESCLSIPNFHEEVTRNTEILLEYQDLTGQHLKKVLYNIESGTVQHEVDHLDGKLFIHRLKGARRSMVFRRLEKMEKKEEHLRNAQEDQTTTKVGHPKRNRTKNKKRFGTNKKKRK